MCALTFSLSRALVHTFTVFFSPSLTYSISCLLFQSRLMLNVIAEALQAVKNSKLERKQKKNSWKHNPIIQLLLYEVVFKKFSFDLVSYVKVSAFEITGFSLGLWSFGRVPYKMLHPIRKQHICKWCENKKTKQTMLMFLNLSTYQCECQLNRNFLLLYFFRFFYFCF